MNEFARTDPEWDFAFDFEEASPFVEYVTRLHRQAQGLDLPDGWVPHTFLVACFGDRIVGRLSLRHELDDFLHDYGGHIGFGVVASARRKGYGREILRQALPRARALGLHRV